MSLKTALLALAMVGTAVAKAAPEASPEPSRPTYSSPSHQPVHGSSYYNEPVNIQGKSHRADLDSNKNNDYTFVHVAGNADLNIGKKPKGVYVAVRPAVHGKNAGGSYDVKEYNQDVAYTTQKGYKEIHHEDDPAPTYYKEDGKLYYRLTDSPKESSYNKPSFHQEPTFKVQKSSYTHLEEPHYKAHSNKEEPSYKPTTYKEPQYKSHQVEPSYESYPKEEHSYKQVYSNKEEPLYKAPKYEEHLSPIYKEPSYKIQKEETSYKTYKEEPTYKTTNEDHSYTLGSSYKVQTEEPSYKVQLKEVVPSYNPYTQKEELSYKEEGPSYKTPIHMGPLYKALVKSEEPLYYKEEPSYKEHKEEPIYKAHKEEPSYKAYKEELAYKVVHKDEPSYKTYKDEPTYKVVHHKEEPSYKVYKEEPSYKPAGYKEPVIISKVVDSYEKRTPNKEKEYKEHSYKEVGGDDLEHGEHYGGKGDAVQYKSASEILPGIYRLHHVKN